MIETDRNVYEPLGGAHKLFHCREHEILLEGPAGTGKSRAILEKANLALMKYPNSRVLAVRKTRKSMTDSVLVTYEDKVLLPNSPIKSGPKRSHRQAYEYPNGSELVIGGMDNADKIMSTEYDFICVFESTELTEDDWEKLTTRLRNNVIPYQQIIGDCNPSYPHHWLNKRCDSGAAARILSRHEDNPSVTEEYLNVLRGLTGARRARLYEGKWVSQEGLVYDVFDRTIHVIPSFDVPASWSRYRSIDFGYTNPFICQWWAENPDGDLFLYREIYKTQQIVADHANAIKRLSAGERFMFNVSDHDAEDRATLQRGGISTRPANKEVISGIQAVEQRLRVGENGKARIYFMEDALVEPDELLIESKKPYSTIQEFDCYIWEKSKEGKAEKEHPVKDNDHGMDAMRYFVMMMDFKQPATRVFKKKPEGW